jgi:hypothetical protein
MVGKLTDLKKLLKLLRENGVEEYKNGDIHVKLGARAYLTTPMMTIPKFEPEKKQQNDDDDLFYSGV